MYFTFLTHVNSTYSSITFKVRTHDKMICRAAWLWLDKKVCMASSYDGLYFVCVHDCSARMWDVPSGARDWWLWLLSTADTWSILCHHQTSHSSLSLCPVSRTSGYRSICRHHGTSSHHLTCVCLWFIKHRLTRDCDTVHCDSCIDRYWTIVTMLVVWSWPGVTGASLSKVNLGFKFPMIMKYLVSVALAGIITILQ